jgi:hypothetical protein
MPFIVAKGDPVKAFVSTLLMASLLASPIVLAGETKDTASAQAAAETWLKAMDAEDYSRAWDMSAANVRNDTSKFAWTLLMGAIHMPLGDFKARTLKHTAAKPGADAVTYEYESRYAKNPKVSETVTTIHEKDGAWRVSGYSVNSK